jgi:hypothetical protein
MAKFKVGDRVRVKSFKKRPASWNYEGEMDYLMGKEIVIKQIDKDGDIKVPARPDQGWDYWYLKQDHVEILEEPKPVPCPEQFGSRMTALWAEECNRHALGMFSGVDLYVSSKKPKSLMTQISNVAKKLLDADTRKLIKYGYLDSELNVTSKCREAMDAIQFQAHKTELVALADEEAAEEKQ